MRTRLYFLLVLLFSLVISMTSPTKLSAQVAVTGKITGTVTDPSGAGVPNAPVTVKGAALLAQRSTQTQSDGSYLFDLLPPGTYELTVTARGFRSYHETGIVITAGFTATVSPRLAVGEVTESVTVQSEPVVDLQNVQASTTFDQQLLQEIPSGRDPWSTVAQMPGATVSTVDVGGNQSYQQSTMQVHGSTPGEQIFSFNGLDLNWPGANGGYTQFYTDHDSFDEFQVVADNAPASVSISGIYMNMVTKSGSNQLHGQAAAYFASSAFEAGVKSPVFQGSPIAAASPITHDRDTSVGAGGPIIKDRWWIFGSYRRYDLREQILAVPTPNGTPTVDVNHQTNTALRSDWQLNSKNKLSFIWLYNEQNRFFRRDTAYQFVSQEASWLQIEPAYILQALWTSQLTNNLLLDVRVGYNKEVFPLAYQPGVPSTAFTRQDVSLNTETGAAPSAFVNPAWVLKYSVGASWYKGSRYGTHNLKFGYEWGDNYNPYLYSINQGINAQYTNGVPLDVVAFDTPFTEKDYFHDTGVYVQDAWTIKQRLTLNLGLRYDRFISFYPKQSTASNLTFPQLFPPTTYPASGNLVDWNNVSPRVGLAFDVTGKGTSVVRFSYGRFYKMQGTQLLEAVNPVGFASKTFTWNDANHDGIPQTSEWLNPANLIAQTGGTTTHIDPHMSRPYSDEFSASYEKQLWRDLRVSAAYYYRVKRNLIGLKNLAAPTADYTPITTLNGQPIVNGVTGQPMTIYNLALADKGLSNILMTNISELNNNSYNGVEFTGVKRMSNRWQLLAGFTVQRQKGDWYLGFSDDALLDDFNNPNFDINRKNNYLNMDSTYVFKIDSTYDLPWKFSTSVNFQHYTGFPVQPTEVFSGPELNQNSVAVILQPAGIKRYPSVNLLNLRISREFSVRDRFKIQPLIDLFNLTNSQTVVSENTVFSGTYLRPSNTVNPFLARIGLRVNF
jgi:Carboxypeptidase regulatory-like domain/TonB dependent receptor